MYTGDCDRVWANDPKNLDDKAGVGIATSRSLGDEDLHSCVPNFDAD